MGRTLSIIALALFGGCSDAGAPDSADLGQQPTGMNDSDVCGVSIALSTPTGMVTVPTTVNANAQVNGGSRSIFNFGWIVERAGGGSFRPTSSGNGASVNFQVTDPGAYHISVIATASDSNASGNPCQGATTIIATPVGARKVDVRARVTAPASTMLPRQDVLLKTWTGTPLDWQEVPLQPGSQFHGMLAGPSGGVPGTVRFIDEFGIDVLAQADMAGNFSTVLLSMEGYTPLLVPFDAGLAPHRFAMKQQGELLSTASYAVTAGMTLGGTIRDELGKPLAGAHFALHSSDGPASSGGVSDATGAWSVRAEPGTYSLAVTAPGEPDLMVPGVALAASAGVDIAYQSPRVPITGVVLATDGKTPLRGALVMLRSHAPVSAAGSISMGAKPVSTDGNVNLDVVTQKDGSLPPLSLPAGVYDALVQPPAGIEAGVTSLSLTVAGPTTWLPTLQPRMTLTGKVRNKLGDPQVGAIVSAIERSGLGRAPTTLTDAQGAYSLLLDPGAPVELFVDPPGGAITLLRAHQSLPSGPPSSGTLDVTLDAGLLLAGTVRPPLGQPLGGALVEIYCASTSPACPDISVALGVAATGSDGRFALTVPDPGQ